MPKTPSVKKKEKEQLKVQIDPEIHRVLRDLCAKSRRSPGGQIEYMTLMFKEHNLENPATQAAQAQAGSGAPASCKGEDRGRDFPSVRPLPRPSVTVSLSRGKPASAREPMAEQARVW